MVVKLKGDKGSGQDSYKLGYKIRTAIYIRVSTEEQAKEGFSIEAQKNRLLAFMKSQEWILFDIYSDEGLSAKPGSVEVRPELKRMLEDIRSGKVDVVLVLRLDRLTRSVLDLYKLLEIFEQYKCAFRSATEIYDTTTPTGKLFITIVAAMAQWERETIAERIKEGMEQMVREGKWHGGPLPYGLDNDMNHIDDEADQVNLIFRMYCSGRFGEDKLSVWMNENGYRYRGELWRASAIRYILQNPIYIGHLWWNTRDDEKETMLVENVIKPILEDPKLFETAQGLRETRRGLHPKQATSTYIFSGRLKCKCGAPCKGTGREKYRYYICTKVVSKQCSFTKVMKEREVEEAFLSNIEKYMRDFDLISEVASTHEEPEIKHDAEISRVEKDLQKIKTRRGNWIKALGDGDISQSEYREHTENDRETERQLMGRLEELRGDLTSHTNKPRTAEEIALLLKNLRNGWDASSPLEKKMMTQITTKTIHAATREDGRIDMSIEYN